jgi:hypothetical protein
MPHVDGATVSRTAKLQELSRRGNPRARHLMKIIVSTPTTVVWNECVNAIHVLQKSSPGIYKACIAKVPRTTQLPPVDTSVSLKYSLRIEAEHLIIEFTDVSPVPLYVPVTLSLNQEVSHMIFLFPDEHSMVQEQATNVECPATLTTADPLVLPA